MNQPRTKIAVWSVGEHAQRNILPALSCCDELSLTGLYTRDPEVLARSSEQYATQGFDTAEALLASDCEAVYLSGPNGVHASQISQCLEHGKSVLVEKTAIPDKQQANRLCQIAESQGLLIMEAFMYRFHPQFEKLQDLISQQTYGRLLSLDICFGFPHLAADNIRYQRVLEGGALLDAGAYTLSAAGILLGESCTLLGGRLHQEPSYEVDTRGAALWENDRGQTARCTWVMGGSYLNRIQVWCEEAHLIVDRAFSKPPTFESSIEVIANGKQVETHATGAHNHFIRMLQHFAKQLRQENLSELAELKTQAQRIAALRQ